MAISRKKKIMYITLIVLLALTTGTALFMNSAMFGKISTGSRLEKIKKSANYRDGSFQNQNFTSVMVQGVSYPKLMKEMMFEKTERLQPEDKIPSMKTDLLNLDAQQELLVWFGHSSYFIQTNGKTFLIDPVLSGHASPFSFAVKAFDGTDVYAPEDFPAIDYLIITHDHWDHLDYKTIIKLKPRIDKIITGLGTGAHFEHWGFDTAQIVELDWYEKTVLDSSMVLHAAPARHFSGRGFTRNQALWAAFILETPTQKIYLGGDGGYDTHFKEIGEKYGPFDLVILEQGQYNEKWRYIHLLPSEIEQAAADLGAKMLMPVHHSKFALARHPWDEPLKKITENMKYSQIKLITPMIGEPVFLNDSSQTFKHWWEGVK